MRCVSSQIIGMLWKESRRLVQVRVVRRESKVMRPTTPRTKNGCGVCMSSKLLLALASSIILGSESRGTHDHILLFHGSGNIACDYDSDDQASSNLPETEWFFPGLLVKAELCFCSCAASSWSYCNFVQRVWCSPSGPVTAISKGFREPSRVRVTPLVTLNNLRIIWRKVRLYSGTGTDDLFFCFKDNRWYLIIS
jgi:hypothetical protein